MDYVWSFRDSIFYGICSCGGSAVSTGVDPVDETTAKKFPMRHRIILFRLLGLVGLGALSSCQLTPGPLTCYQCFHVPSDDPMSNIPNASTTQSTPFCTRSDNCTINGGVCIYSETKRENRLEAYCLGESLFSTPNGCWIDANDANTSFCFCTENFCNKILSEDENLFDKFAKLDSNPFVGNIAIEKEREKYRQILREQMDQAIRESTAFVNDVDIVPVNLTDYEDFLKNTSTITNDINAAISRRIHAVGATAGITLGAHLLLFSLFNSLP